MVAEPADPDSAAASLNRRMAPYRERLEQALDRLLPAVATPPGQLHQAMREAVFAPGERFTALVVYATGEALGAAPDLLDAPAVAVELMQAFGRIHETLASVPIERGQQAVTILAADALQPLAFHALATAPALAAKPDVQTRMVALLAEACGSNGLVGGRALQVAMRTPDAAELEHAYRLRSGRLLRASVLCAALCQPGLAQADWHALERFSDLLGIGHGIRADLSKAAARGTGRGARDYPGLFGIERAQSRTAALAAAALAAIAGFGPAANGLRAITRYLVLEER